MHMSRPLSSTSAEVSAMAAAPARNIPPRLTSGEQAALYIRRLVFDGDLKPGDRVPQDVVAAALGMSRIPVREALIALEREGWVTIETHRGAFVNGFDRQAVRDHYALFALIYGFAARLALQRNPAVVSQLYVLLRELNTSDDPSDVARLAIGFHRALIEAADAPRLKVLLGAMSGLIPGNFFQLVPGSIESEKKGLAEIGRAMKKGDGDRAVRGYEDMLRHQGDLVVKLFEGRGFFDTLPLSEPGPA
jgi:DNA-binding GntR family transcriptional regulator